MHRTLRLLPYVVAGAVLVIASLAAPAAWATPGQSFAAQTVPTATRPSVATQPPQEQPTAQPPAIIPGDTPQPTLAAQSTATAPSTCSNNAQLTLSVDRRAVWPGATVVFTSTLTNAGRQPLKAVVLLNQLPAQLQPVAVISGNATWQGTTLSASANSLAPAARLAVVYSAKVSSAQTGTPIVVRASSTTAGCPPQIVSVTLGPPPSELPRTGGSIR